LDQIAHDIGVNPRRYLLYMLFRREIIFDIPTYVITVPERHRRQTTYRALRKIAW